MKFNFRQRFKYWFDSVMAKGSISMVKILLLVTGLVVFILSFIIIAFNLNEEGDAFNTIWDIIATTINAWMPSSYDGGPLFIFLTAIAAIVGLLFTSVLIGIIGSAIEEKIDELKKGNSLVLEENHIVIIGFNIGEYSLIEELITADEENNVFVIADEMEREKMESAIKDNVDIPRGVKIICRNIDIGDPVALECCNLKMARTVIINSMSDDKTIKSILAVNKVLKDEEKKPYIIAGVTKDDYMLPEDFCNQNNILMFQTNEMIARVIAHSATQPGLTVAFKELLNFESDEIYVNKIKGSAGRTFLELTASLAKATPIGIKHNGINYINPDGGTFIEEDDEIIFFGEDKNAYELRDVEIKNVRKEEKRELEVLSEGKITIIGYNEVIDTLVTELPENTGDIIITNVEKNEKENLKELIKNNPDRHIIEKETDIFNIDNLEELVKDSEHVILLSEHSQDSDEDDINNILYLLRIRDIKDKYNLSFTITSELKKESSLNLVENEDPTDFVIASKMISMVLAQIAEDDDVFHILNELLTNKGNEIYLKPVRLFNLKEKDYSINALRQISLSYGYIFLGYQKKDEIILNPNIDDRLNIDLEDSFILIGKQ